ncbi:hypothetical protein Tsubulata_009340 [Turnera subulata]|uniref:Uncharacterized protein n=1 Tax=Turnera subulata TaxID=218843 RepID=A0A9Q0JP61_9ROSI|nr:hypothetical protein Tsubulata_009340 [Turnera subulata]
MRFFKRLAGLLGFVKDDGTHEVRDHHNNHSHHHHQDQEDHSLNHHHQQQPNHQPRPAGPRKGFAVPVQVAVDRPHLGPVLLPCTSGDGGVQGLRWYAKRLRIDEDGDVADEFLEEVLPETSTNDADDQHKPLPRFEVKYSTRSAKVKNQVLSADGKIEHRIEHQGRLQVVQV